ILPRTAAASRSSGSRARPLTRATSKGQPGGRFLGSMIGYYRQVAVCGRVCVRGREGLLALVV
ncbi:MAG: hypothetical protein ACRDPR_06890, partial [Nocardioidaceae bacterium]